MATKNFATKISLNTNPFTTFIMVIGWTAMLFVAALVIFVVSILAFLGWLVVLIYLCWQFLAQSLRWIMQKFRVNNR